MAMALASPSFGQSLDIYGQVAKATTAPCGHDRVLGKHACNVSGRVGTSSIKRNLRPTFVVALSSGDKTTRAIRTHELDTNG